MEGKTIADHWPLLVLIGATFGGVFVFVRALLNALDNRQHENLRLFFTNGGKAILEDAAKAGAIAALAEHEVRCPQAPLVESIQERLVTLERTR